MSDANDDSWEKLANDWREAAGQNGSPRLNPIGLIRWLKHSGTIKDYVRVPDSASPTAKGEYDPHAGVIYLTESTWRGAEIEVAHDEWSVVHECAHAILGHKEIRYRASAEARNNLSWNTTRDEVRANRLTASLIAPFDKAAFKPGMTILEVSKKFNLSLPAATKRLEEFERTYRRRNGIRRPLPPGIIDFLTEQKRKGYNVTSLNGLEHLAPMPIKQFEGDPCPNCHKFMLVRNGIGIHCDSCGARPGDD